MRKDSIFVVFAVVVSLAGSALIYANFSEKRSSEPDSAILTGELPALADQAPETDKVTKQIQPMEASIEASKEAPQSAPATAQNEETSETLKAHISSYSDYQNPELVLLLRSRYRLDDAKIRDVVTHLELYKADIQSIEELEIQSTADKETLKNITFERHARWLTEYLGEDTYKDLLSQSSYLPY